MAKKPFRLEQLFGSKTRARLLGLFLLNPSQEFFVRELTRKIGAQLNSVRRELANLIALEIILEKIKTEGKGPQSKKKFYAANPDFLLLDDLRSLFTKVQILLKNNLVQEIDDKGKITYLAFTGRFMNAKEAPTDILIVGTISHAVLQKVVSQFEEEFGHEINYTLMPKEEFLYRRQVADRFLLSVLERSR